MEAVRLIGHMVSETIIMVFVLFICVVLFIDHTVSLVHGVNANKYNTKEHEKRRLLDRRIKEQVHTMLMESHYLESMYVKHVELKLKLIEKEKSMARSIKEAEERMLAEIAQKHRNIMKCVSYKAIYICNEIHHIIVKADTTVADICVYDCDGHYIQFKIIDPPRNKVNNRIYLHTGANITFELSVIFSRIEFIDIAFNNSFKKLQVCLFGESTEHKVNITKMKPNIYNTAAL